MIVYTLSQTSMDETPNEAVLQSIHSTKELALDYFRNGIEEFNDGTGPGAEEYIVNVPAAEEELAEMGSVWIFEATVWHLNEYELDSGEMIHP